METITPMLIVFVKHSSSHDDETRRKMKTQVLFVSRENPCSFIEKPNEGRDSECNKNKNKKPIKKIQEFNTNQSFNTFASKREPTTT